MCSVYRKCGINSCRRAPKREKGGVGVGKGKTLQAASKTAQVSVDPGEGGGRTESISSGYLSTNFWTSPLGKAEAVVTLLWGCKEFSALLQETRQSCIHT